MTTDLAVIRTALSDMIGYAEEYVFFCDPASEKYVRADIDSAHAVLASLDEEEEDDHLHDDYLLPTDKPKE